MVVVGERAQLYTLEGITAGLIILLGLFFALQAATATPGAAGSLNPHAEEQSRSTVQETLNGMSEETLREAVLYWDESEEAFHCTPSDSKYYPGFTETGCSGPESGTPPVSFGSTLEQQLGDSLNYNVVLRYHDGSGTGEFDRRLLMHQGQPGSSAVRASTSVVLENDDELVHEDGTSTGTKIGQDPSPLSIPARGTDSDEYEDEDPYNVVYVEVVVWP